MSGILERIDRLKRELDALRPLPPDAVAQVGQKLRLESNYHSNAVEGNSLTLGETRGLILHGLTAHGKPMRDHLDIQGHDEAVKAVEDAVAGERGLTEAFIRGLHAVLLKEPYEIDASTPDGRPARRRIEIGAYKSAPNNVRTSTGEMHYFTPPEQVRPAMGDLLDWYAARQAAGEHPIVLAATFHYRFVRIHPFDDGNGRMARLLTNMILIRHGYTVAMVRHEDRDRYIEELERADAAGDLARFIDYIASCCEYALDLHLRAARGEPVERPEDIDREIALFKQSLVENAAEGGQVAARDHFEEIVRPFHDYCRSRIAMFRGSFARIEDDLWRVEGKTADNRIFSVVNPRGTRISEIPERARDVSSVFYFALDRFQSTGIDIELVVEGRRTSSRCDWKFRLNGDVRESYGGQDPDELKNGFNRILRAMMHGLRGPMPKS